jgi:hypothetical protein
VVSGPPLKKTDTNHAERDPVVVVGESRVMVGTSDGWGWTPGYGAPLLGVSAEYPSGDHRLADVSGGLI